MFERLLLVVAVVAVVVVAVVADELPGCPGESDVRAASSSTEMLLRVAAPCRYDRYSKPDGADAGPTLVYTHVHVYFLGSVEAQNLFTAHLLVRFRWLDPRLAFAAHAPDVEQVTSERTLRAHIWVPKVYLVNEQQSVMVVGAQEDALIAVQPDGMVSLATRVKVTLYCMMALAKFPFDQQHCPMIFETWTYNSSELLLHWEADGGVSVNQHLHLTAFRLLNMEPDFNMAADALAEINAPTPGVQSSYFGKQGNYSSLSVQFHLAREVGHYIMDYYVPSILLVVVSWVSFWLDPNAVPGRTTLGTSTMLTFITLTRNTGSSLPKVSYIKATEIWFIVCTAFIFGSLVEFAFVNTIWRRKQNVELKKVNSKYILKSTLTPQMHRKQLHANMDRCQSWPSIIDKDSVGAGAGESPGKDMRNFYNQGGGRNTLSVDSADSIQTDPNPAESSSDVILSVPTPGAGAPAHSFTTMTPQEISQWIDERSRIVFPASFVLFNVLYWGFVWI